MFKRLIVGQLQTNCYILTKNNKVIIIDPGDEAEYIKSNIAGEVVGILLTHNHFDHIGAVEELKNHYNTKVYNYENVDNELVIDNFIFEVINNPGHSYDSVSYLIDNVLFCGDFIFEGTIGRTDLPTGNMLEMQESIKCILKYDDDLIICPGHGNTTNLKEERISLNRFI